MLGFVAEYEEREELIALGAKWDFFSWQWKIERKDYPAFSKWLRGGVISNELYFLEKSVVCADCGKKFRCVAVGVGAYIEDGISPVYGENGVNVFAGLDLFEGDVLKKLVKDYGLKKRFFAPYGFSRLLNACRACGKIIAPEEIDAQFFDSANTRILRYKSPEDMFFKGAIAFGLPLSEYGENITEISEIFA